MLHKIRRFLLSPGYLPIPLAVGVLGLFGGEKTAFLSMVLNALLVALVLFVCDDMLPAFLPAFSIIVIGTTLLSNLEIVLPLIPFAIPAALGLIFHLICYRRPLYIGKSLYGLIAASAAVLLSGIGTSLSTRDYTSLAAVYHIIGLSVGLIVLYFLFASNRRAERTYDPIDYFLLSMMLLGLLCAAVILRNFLQWLIPNFSLLQLKDSGNLHAYFTNIPYRNTIATLLIMCIPSAFYFAKRVAVPLLEIGFFLVGLFTYLALVLTIARTALVFGTILLILCLVYYLHGKGSRRVKCFNFFLLLVGAIGALSLLGEPLYSLFELRMKNGLVSAGEVRVKLLLCSFDDVISHPIFGIGITSTIHSDLYSAPGCIGWYHMYFPQLWGSMGTVGLVAYTYQLILRAKLIFTKPDAQSIAMGLVYLGLFLYSQTDPGEFAPIPYAVITVLLFVLLEGREKQFAQPKLEE